GGLQAETVRDRTTEYRLFLLDDRADPSGGISRKRGRLLLLRGGSPFATRPPHLVPKLHHAALVRLDPRQVERHILVQFLEEPDSSTDQDRQDGVPDFFSEPETQTFRGDRTSSHEPDATEVLTQTPVHQLREIA